MEKAATGSASRAVRQVRENTTGPSGTTAATRSSAASGSDRPIAAASGAATVSGKDTKSRSASTTTATTTPSTNANPHIKFKTTFRNTIYDTMLRRGWKETTDNDWDFYWADREYIYELLDSVHLENGQRVNHFRNGRELCRKDHLIKNLKRAKRQMEKRAKAGEELTANELEMGSYDFFPVTYTLPGEYSIFVEEFRRHQGVWIMKPTSKAQGKGIFLFTKLSQISDWRTDYRAQGKGIFLFTKLSQISDWRTDYRWQPQSQQVETYVVQKYISNPYLVGGKKFDLRLYALVPSFSPLEIYLYRGGFARFTNSRYSNNPSDIANSFIHLTNVAIQKTSEHYNKKHGGKWDLRNLKMYMMSKHGVEAINKLFYEIQMVIIKSVLSVEKIMINDKHCFELYGYDIMIDENLKPWLLEVNASPSLSANTSSDYQLKCGMLNDMLDILDLENT
ncbi:hypothetical protein P43SY_010005 [Pythium insidiosum]|uniref:Tubulin--tyrosine ligase-like protein 9 n=1 Tax=Pythium insidiosum TaxID=114742 RepID=A0AAD5M411_PYTIN|nr:hypothetical protein P43SY_010005 [Pythium insidiosum]